VASLPVGAMVRRKRRAKKPRYRGDYELRETDMVVVAVAERHVQVESTRRKGRWGSVWPPTRQWILEEYVRRVEEAP